MINILRGNARVADKPHKFIVSGSSPLPATNVIVCLDKNNKRMNKIIFNVIKIMMMKIMIFLFSLNLNG